MNTKKKEILHEFVFHLIISKGGFFSESAMCFSNLQILKKKLFQKTILNLILEFPANNSKVLLTGNLSFKFRIVFGIIFFGDLEIGTMHCTFLKKATFRQPTNSLSWIN